MKICAKSDTVFRKSLDASSVLALPWNMYDRFYYGMQKSIGKCINIVKSL